MGEVVSRMAELRTMAADVTKNDGDIENYSKEFRELQSQLQQMGKEKFNGISLFAIGDHTGDALSGKEINVSVYISGNGGKPSDRYSYELLTHPSGVSSDGSISLGVTNLQHLTSLGWSGRGWKLTC